MPSRSSHKKIRLSLRRGEKFGKGLRSLAMLQVKAALAELDGNNVSPEPVHHARTYIKKVRSIIQLAAPALGKVRRDHMLELLQEAGSRLGPLRDSEVQIQCLDLILETAGLPAEPFYSLRNGLADIAKQRRANDWRRVPRISGFLNEILRDIPDWPLDQLGAKDIKRRIRRTYRRGRTILDACRAGDDPELFHTWRKLAKQLGYQLRITAKYWPDSARALISRLEIIGELAGRDRDFALLIRTMKGSPKNKASEQIMDIMTAEMISLRRQSAHLGDLFYRDKPRSFVERLDL